ncbi:MAG: DUF3307 domain-containing protein [Candidatus Hydrogenedens sp.]|nr:DUF3307 domain-containing protein [Candidatus Hydrogenedens sp.]
MENEFPIAFLPLLCAHLLADFLFQTDKMVQNKHRIRVLLLHSGIAAGSAALLYNPPGSWVWLVLGITWVAHFLTDAFKTFFRWNSVGGFLFDQAAHIGVAAVLAWWLISSDIPPGWGYPDDLYPMFLLFISAVLVQTRGIGFLLMTVLRPWTEEIEKHAAEATEAERPPTGGLTRGGMWIGWLERTLILIFVCAGSLPAAGFVITAKSILRFPDMNRPTDTSYGRMVNEYIIIGTLASFTLGLINAYSFRWLYHLLFWVQPLSPFDFPL